MARGAFFAPAGAVAQQLRPRKQPGSWVMGHKHTPKLQVFPWIGARQPLVHPRAKDEWSGAERLGRLRPFPMGAPKPRLHSRQVSAWGSPDLRRLGVLRGAEQKAAMRERSAALCSMFNSAPANDKAKEPPGRGAEGARGPEGDG